MGLQECQHIKSTALLSNGMHCVWFREYSTSIGYRDFLWWPSPVITCHSDHITSVNFWSLPNNDNELDELNLIGSTSISRHSRTSHKFKMPSRVHSRSYFVIEISDNSPGSEKIIRGEEILVKPMLMNFQTETNVDSKTERTTVCHMQYPVTADMLLPITVPKDKPYHTFTLTSQPPPPGTLFLTNLYVVQQSIRLLHEFDTNSSSKHSILHSPSRMTPSQNRQEPDRRSTSRIEVA
jgi:hypothetical protein